MFVRNKVLRNGVFQNNARSYFLSRKSNAVIRELKNHDGVHDDDVCWLGKDWNENVSFGGKKET